MIVLTTDADYRPLIKDRPKNYAWEVLDGYRGGMPADLEPLARRRPDFKQPATASCRRPGSCRRSATRASSICGT